MHVELNQVLRCFTGVKSHQKTYLPQKTCPVCQRPFAWRKKWARDWEQVVYCSERCRRSRSRKDEGVQQADA
jgi:hypothetical protein